jgi:molecular chaperone HtpG
VTTPTETLEFQAEARQLLQLVIHSIYSNKDIFLRELISNASDALDKLRLEAFRDKDLQVDTSDLHIDIEVDKDNRTLTVRDNGIGMSRDDVVHLIGTIAKSGTAEFLRTLKDAKDAAASQDLIGQFGVGFYSSFMVADKVTLLTRRAGQTHATRWESSGDATYTIESVDDAPQGTAVTLHLKPADAEDHLFDYTSDWKIREIVKQYSDFIAWPIKMEVERTGQNLDSDGKAARGIETINSMKALWARSKGEATDEEYREFYRHVSRDWNDPLETIQLKAEGTFEYQALLFIPSQAPYDLFMREHRRGVQLYVKRVFIMDDCEALMPDYLRFIKGVVDAQDLSLNVSREILQQDRQIQLMRRRLVKKVLSTVKDMMAANPGRYTTFWTQFGRAVKEGLLSDTDNRDAILAITSFASTYDAQQSTTLRQYVERMKEGQQHIYYITGESRSIIESSPHMEAFTAKGWEVLLLTDPVDDMWVDSVPEFDGTPLQSIAKGQVDLDTEDEKKNTESERDQQNKEFATLLSWMMETLEADVKQVRLSSRLTTSPACIVADAQDITPTMERMYRAMGQDMPPIKRILEVNPTHPLVSELRKAHAAHTANSGQGDDGGLTETAELLYGMALLAEGGELANPSRFVRTLADRLAHAVTQTSHPEPDH